MESFIVILRSVIAPKCLLLSLLMSKRKKDVRIQFGIREKKVTSKSNKVKYNFCIMNVGEILFAQRNIQDTLAGNVKGCLLVPDDLKQKALGILKNLEQQRKEKTIEIQNLLNKVHVGKYEDEHKEITREEETSSRNPQVKLVR